MYWLPVWLPMPPSSTQLARTGGGQTMSDLLIPGWACEDLNLGPLPYQGVGLCAQVAILAVRPAVASNRT
jgi:hypothetical protein